MKQEWIDRPEGGSAFGLKLLSRFALMCGRPAARLVLYPVTLYFLLRRGPERRASRKYLQQVTGRKPSLWQVAKHIYVFAAVTLDRIFLLAEKFRRFDIRVFGLDHMRNAWQQGNGVLVFSAHFGSFEALRVLADLRDDVKVRVVIDIEQNPALSTLLNSLNPTLAASVINARQEGTNTALAIKEALDQKALVTLLVERARPGNDVLVTDFLGRPAAFPTTPWLLAAALKVPVVLCFGVYRGGNRYDLYFEVFAQTVTLNRANRQAGLRECVERFSQRLAHYTRMEPYNWFNFYDFWQLRNNDTTVGADAGADDDAMRRTSS